jgi:DNA polymerase-3 subunit epsilon
MPGLPISSTRQRAQEIWARKPVFLDTETTGLGDTAEIIEVCVIDWDGLELFNSLVRPRRSIPLDAYRLHGISDSMVQDAPSWLQVWPKLESILKGRHVGIYNVDFDLRMLQRSHRSIGLTWRHPDSYFFDVMKMFADCYNFSKWQTLDAAGRLCHIPISNSHRACQDTQLAREVFLHIVNGGQIR